MMLCPLLTPGLATSDFPNEFATAEDKAYLVDDTMLALFGSKNEDFSIISNEDIYNDDVNLSVEIAVVELVEEGDKKNGIEEGMCILYSSDAADDAPGVSVGERLTDD